MQVMQEQRYTTVSNKQELLQESLAFQLKKVKAPLFVLNLVATNKPLYKLYSTYLAFKALEPTGEILDYTGNVHDIAHLFKISYTKLNSHVSQLVKLGLLERTLKRLTIAPYSKLNSLHPTESKQYKFIKINPNSPLEYQLRSKLINADLERQAHVVVRTIARFDNINTVQAIQAHEVYRLSMYQAFRTNTNPATPLPPCNLEVAISQRGIANLLNLKSQTSGNYWERVLEARGLIKTYTRTITSEARTKERNAPRCGLWGYNQKDNVSFISLPNRIEFCG